MHDEDDSRRAVTAPDLGITDEARCLCGCGQQPSRGCRWIRGHNRRLDKPDLSTLFWANVKKTDGCWNWVGDRDPAGYGKFSSRRLSSNRAHRYAYEALVGPIPPGLTIDHLCRNKACVNPDHLEPVTSRINTLRSGNPAAINAAKTHCKRGHELAGRNLIVDKAKGNRACRACRTQMEQKRRRSAAALARSATSEASR